MNLKNLFKKKSFIKKQCGYIDSNGIFHSTLSSFKKAQYEIERNKAFNYFCSELRRNLLRLDGRISSRTRVSDVFIKVLDKDTYVIPHILLDLEDYRKKVQKLQLKYKFK